MPTFKKVYPVYPEQRGESYRSGFYHPAAILILAAITLSVALIFYINSKVLFKVPEQSNQSQSQAQLEIGKEVTLTGKVTKVNFEPMTRDGAGEVGIDSQGKKIKISVSPGEIPNTGCEYDDFNVGDEVEVFALVKSQSTLSCESKGVHHIIKVGDVDETANPDLIGANWKTYSNTKYNYTLKYPIEWSTKEEGSAVVLSPPKETNPTIAITVGIINYKLTPPLPVNYTYQTLRKVATNFGDVLVQMRSPGSEQYMAQITSGDLTVVFSFGRGLDRKYDALFDQILSTFQFLN